MRRTAVHAVQGGHLLRGSEPSLGDYWKWRAAGIPRAASNCDFIVLYKTPRALYISRGYCGCIPRTA
eukprot:scaffold203_cov386-Prasinococcus_capsulatus_cf.AAC.8